MDFPYLHNISGLYFLRIEENIHLKIDKVIKRWDPLKKKKIYTKIRLKNLNNTINVRDFINYCFVKELLLMIGSDFNEYNLNSLFLYLTMFNINKNVKGSNSEYPYRPMILQFHNYFNKYPDIFRNPYLVEEAFGKDKNNFFCNVNKKYKKRRKTTFKHIKDYCSTNSEISSSSREDLAILNKCKDNCTSECKNSLMYVCSSTSLNLDVNTLNKSINSTEKNINNKENCKSLKNNDSTLLTNSVDRFYVNCKKNTNMNDLTVMAVTNVQIDSKNGPSSDDDFYSGMSTNSESTITKEVYLPALSGSTRTLPILEALQCDKGMRSSCGNLTSFKKHKKQTNKKYFRKDSEIYFSAKKYSNFSKNDEKLDKKIKMNTKENEPKQVIIYDDALLSFPPPIKKFYKSLLNNMDEHIQQDKDIKKNLNIKKCNRKPNNNLSLPTEWLEEIHSKGKFMKEEFIENSEPSSDEKTNFSTGIETNKDSNNRKEIKFKKLNGFFDDGVQNPNITKLILSNEEILESYGSASEFSKTASIENNSPQVSDFNSEKQSNDYFNTIKQSNNNMMQFLNERYNNKINENNKENIYKESTKSSFEKLSIESKVVQIIRTNNIDNGHIAQISSFKNNDNDFDKLVTKSGRPVVLYNQSGFPLTDFNGKILKNNLGAPSLNINSYEDIWKKKLSVYDVNSLTIDDYGFNPIKIPFIDKELKIVDNKGNPIQLYNNVGFPLTDEDGFLLYNSKGKPLVTLDKKYRPLCCLNGGPIYLSNGKMWLTEKHKFLIKTKSGNNIQLNENEEIQSKRQPVPINKQKDTNIKNKTEELTIDSQTSKFEAISTILKNLPEKFRRKTSLIDILLDLFSEADESLPFTPKPNPHGSKIKTSISIYDLLGNRLTDNSGIPLRDKYGSPKLLFNKNGFAISDAYGGPIFNSKGEQLLLKNMYNKVKSESYLHDNKLTQAEKPFSNENTCYRHTNKRSNRPYSSESDVVDQQTQNQNQQKYYKYKNQNYPFQYGKNYQQLSKTVAKQGLKAWSLETPNIKRYTIKQNRDVAYISPENEISHDTMNNYYQTETIPNVIVLKKYATPIQAPANTYEGLEEEDLTYEHINNYPFLEIPNGYETYQTDPENIENQHNEPMQYVPSKQTSLQNNYGQMENIHPDTYNQLHPYYNYINRNVEPNYYNYPKRWYK